MDYAAWKLFLDAAEFGSLSKVAVAYGTSQPHISRRVSELEQACGGRLFERNGRGVALASAMGQQLAKRLIGGETVTIDMPVTSIKPIRFHALWPVAVRSVVLHGRIRDSLGW